MKFIFVLSGAVALSLKSTADPKEAASAAEPATLGGAKIPANPGLTEADSTPDAILCRDPFAADSSQPAAWCSKWLQCVAPEGSCQASADSEADTCWQTVKQNWGPGVCEDQCAFWGDKEAKLEGEWTKRVEGFFYGGGNIPDGMELVVTRDEAKELCLVNPECGGITTDGERWWLKTIEHVQIDSHHHNPLPGAEQHWHTYVLSDRVNEPDVFPAEPHKDAKVGDFLAGRGKEKCVEMCRDAQDSLAKCVSRVSFYKGEVMQEKADNPIVYADFTGSCLEQLWSLKQASDPTHAAVSNFKDGSGCPFH